MAPKAYEHPKVHDFGTLGELTMQASNKVGPTPDIFTAITNGQVVGSLTGIIN